MPHVRKIIKGSVQMKSGRLYAVVNLYDKDNKRKRRFIDTGANPRNQKSIANEFVRQVLEALNDARNVPFFDQLVEVVDKCNKEYKGAPDVSRYVALLNEKLECKRKQAPTRRSGGGSIPIDMPFVDFLNLWLQTKKKIADNTYDGYKTMIECRISEFFIPRGSTLESLEPEDFEDFYDFLRIQYNLKEATALHHHRMMKQALDYGVKKGPLLYNVMDKVETPGDSDFQGDYYKAEEALEMLEIAKSDPLYIVILLTTFYGFRRSEVLGLRWSAIDLKSNTINVERKVVLTSRYGKKELQDKKKMKSNSSRRTLPLISIVKEALLKELAQQEENRRVFGKAYSNRTEGYICVNPLGELFNPEYVTHHFRRFLNKNKLRVIRFHDLRHTCATLLVMNGISLLHVSKWLGHSNMAVTEKYYLHFDVKSQIDSAIKMGQIIPHQLADDVKEILIS